jgi:hypothetical protein
MIEFDMIEVRDEIFIITPITPIPKATQSYTVEAVLTRLQGLFLSFGYIEGNCWV